MGEADIRWGTAGVCNQITDIVRTMLERIPPHRVGFQVCEKCRPCYDCMIGIWSYFQSWAQRVFKPRNRQRQKRDGINVSRSFVGWLTFKISSLKCWETMEKNPVERWRNIYWDKVSQPEISSSSIRWRLSQSPREWKQENPGVKCFLNVSQRSVMLVIRNTALWACSESTHRCWTTEAFCEMKFSSGVMENLKGCSKKEVWKW